MLKHLRSDKFATQLSGRYFELSAHARQRLASTIARLIAGLIARHKLPRRGETPLRLLVMSEREREFYMLLPAKIG